MADIIKNQFCVIGLGEFGFAVARSLSEKGAYVLAVDRNMERIEAVKKYVAEAIQFDATDPTLLKEHGVCEADVVIVAIGEAFEPVVLISMELLKEGVKRVISRASSKTQEEILERIGIEEIIHPERDEGIRMATSLLSSSISDFFKLSDEVGIFEIEAPDDMIGYTLAELKIKERYKLSLITIKRMHGMNETNETEDAGDGEKDGSNKETFEVLGVLEGDTKIRKTDRLIIMGNQDSVEKLIDLN